MKRIVLFILTGLPVTVLVLSLSPLTARADKSAFPTGTYTTAITLADVEKYGLPSPYPEILVGDWEMIFRANGIVDVINLSTGDSAQGVYFTNQTVLIFGKDSGVLDCDSPAYAVYKWSTSGSALILTAASEGSDRCWGRYIVNTSHPLVKVP